MAAFDPYANQGGPAAWDPQHDDNSRELAEKLLGEVDADEVENEVKEATRKTQPDIDDDPHFAPDFSD